MGAEWANWINGDCDVTCGTGSTKRSRECLDEDGVPSGECAGSKDDTFGTCTEECCPSNYCLTMLKYKNAV